MPTSLARRGATTAGVAVAVVAAMTGFAPGAAHAAAPRVAIAKSAPAWLSHARKLGAAAASARQTVEVYLAPKGGLAALQAEVTALSTPGSASYHRFLTPAGYYAAYAPTAAEVASVTAYLKGEGLKVVSIDPHNRFVTASGTTHAAQGAFGVKIYRYAHDGQLVTAPSSEVSLPASVSASILGVSGLDTTRRYASTDTTTGTGAGTSADLPASIKAAHASPSAAPPAAFENGRPCSSYYGQLDATYEADYSTPLPAFQGKTLPYAVCGYTGVQFRSAYEGSTTLTGAGVTVGIVDAYDAPTIAKDAETYADDNGDGSYNSGQYTSTDLKPFTHQSDCGPSGWYGEQTLDVEATHAMAPDADIHFYGAASCEDNDLLAADRQAVDDDAVQVVSDSFGDVEEDATSDYIAASEQVFMQGATEGISFLFSSGDDGDELAATGLKQADYQTSDPYVTAVGGTSTGIDGNGDISLQTGWGTEKYTLSSDGTSWNPVGFLYGSGGGYSKLFNRPSYQDGVVPANAPAGRAVPDVAMDADPNTGMLIGETQTFPDHSTAYSEYRIGGTSLASPLFAGMVALLDQQSGGGNGFLNPALYKDAGTTDFTDVKGNPKQAGNVRVDYVNGVDATGGEVYSVRTFDQDSSLTTTKGWDDTTGLGVLSPAIFTE